jgi:hypothetical protein
MTTSLSLPKSSYITGTTPNGVFLIGGLFTAHDQDGISIDLSYDLVNAQGMRVDWVDFLADAGRQKDWKWDWAVEKMASIINTEANSILKCYCVYADSLIRSGQVSLDFNGVNMFILNKKRECHEN